MQITIIIPHLNQPAQLADCLRSVHAQTGLPEGLDMRVIVVDNGSASLPEAVVSAFPDVTLLQEPTPGPGPARNRGIAAADSPLLAFIDADCLAAPGWLSAILSAFENPATQVIGGDVRVGYRDPDQPSFIEPYEAIYSYRNEEHIAEGFSGTGNLAMRAEVFDAVGPFAGLEVAEDRDWGLRARAAGYPAAYVAQMIIYHPARDSFADLKLKWNRHIAHDFARVSGATGQVKWTVKALAMLISPLAEIRTILRSDRIGGGRERWLALACLIGIRAYRSARMLSVQIRGNAASYSGAWNRS